MVIDTIIFDWSGTLSDDFPCVLNTINKILVDYGMPPITADYLRNNYEADPLEFYRKLGGKDITREDLNLRYNHHFKDEKPRPIEGAESVLNKLNNYGMTLMILSTHLQENLNREIQEYGFSIFFKPENIFGGVINKTKVLEDIKGIPEETLFVGDTTVDIEAGNNAGVKTVAVPGYHLKEMLEKQNPNHTIERLEGLLSIV